MQDVSIYITLFFTYSIYSKQSRTLFILLPLYSYLPLSPPNMSDESDDSIDPAETYPQEEFIAEQNILQSFGRRIEAKMRAKMEAGSSRTRRYINRDHEGAHAQRLADYFGENPLYSDAMFRRRFRMRRPVFLRIVNDLGAWLPILLIG
jgi:hypothetical protein